MMHALTHSGSITNSSNPSKTAYLNDVHRLDCSELSDHAADNTNNNSKNSTLFINGNVPVPCKSRTMKDVQQRMDVVNGMHSSEKYRNEEFEKFYSCVNLPILETNVNEDERLATVNASEIRRSNGNTENAAAAGIANYNSKPISLRNYEACKSMLTMDSDYLDCRIFLDSNFDSKVCTDSDVMMHKSRLLHSLSCNDLSEATANFIENDCVIDPLIHALKAFTSTKNETLNNNVSNNHTVLSNSLSCGNLHNVMNTTTTTNLSHSVADFALSPFPTNIRISSSDDRSSSSSSGNPIYSNNYEQKLQEILFSNRYTSFGTNDTSTMGSSYDNLNGLKQSLSCSHLPTLSTGVEQSEIDSMVSNILNTDSFNSVAASSTKRSYKKKGASKTAEKQSLSCSQLPNLSTDIEDYNSVAASAGKGICKKKVVSSTSAFVLKKPKANHPGQKKDTVKAKALKKKPTTLKKLVSADKVKVKCLISESINKKLISSSSSVAKRKTGTILKRLKMNRRPVRKELHCHVCNATKSHAWCQRVIAMDGINPKGEWLCHLCAIFEKNFERERRPSIVEECREMYSEK